MLPKQNNFPEFVPDQLLTSDQLNELFSYLEEQERLTRTNLIGIGIVCGLDVVTSADGTSITITQGCGVTSDGYIISVPTTVYTEYSTYNPVKDRLYEKFVDITTRTPIISNIYELEEAGVTENTTDLSADFLNDKVVLLYVEILEENAKNCNPNSCDDKGIEVTITFRPLLISKADVATLQSSIPGNNISSYESLPVLKMPRFNVPATTLISSAQVFESYMKILSTTFIKQVEQSLSQTYNILSPLVADLYDSDPFAGLADSFTFLYDSSITYAELINLQYYYDLFSDILLAYEEMRKTGMELICMCCPDNNLFRLHLLLDAAIPDTTLATSLYRQYFIPSPAVDCHCKKTNELRWLFKRMVLLIQRFFVSPAAQAYFQYSFREVAAERLAQVKITPSKFGDIPLSEKSIPFYYDVVEGTDQLYQYWDIEKMEDNTANQILSYNADEYNTTDDFVLNPLKYDLEPYNFLRIEGHIGMTYQNALKNIINLKNRFRLPFNVVALSADIASVKSSLLSLGQATNATSLLARYEDQLKSDCQFQDMETLYDTLVTELTCALCKEMKYYYALPFYIDQGTQGQAQASILPLFKKCDPSFQVSPNTMGAEFELYYQNISNDANAGQYFLYNYNSITGRAYEGQNYTYFTLMYTMEKLFETLASSLSAFKLLDFTRAYANVKNIATQIETALVSAADDTSAATTITHLDRLISLCIIQQFETLYKDYLLRWIYVMMLQKFGYFIRLHPGIQHKAGVPIGGTFIIVYHENASSTSSATNVLSAFSDANAKRQVTGDIAQERAAASGTTMATDIGNAKVKQGFQLKDILAGSKTANKEQINALKILLDAQEAARTTFDSLVSQIGNNIVIADFYLPYLCYSDCPPIYYMVNDNGADTVTITMDPTVFCSDDNKMYSPTVSPQGGTVSGEGFSTAPSGITGFNPAGVILDGQKQKTVTLTYTLGQQTATVNILVCQKPTANFTISDGSAPTIKVFTDTSLFADKYQWDFGDSGTSTDQNPTHDFGKAGNYNVTLTVTNYQCTNSIIQSVTVEAPVQKTCLSLKDVSSGFNGLQSIDDKSYAFFTREYTDFNDVATFFKDISVLENQPLATQINYFKTQNTPAKLIKWLSDLSQLVESNFKALVLATYRLLIDVALYIACIQQEDIDKAEVPMAEVLKAVVEQLTAMRTFIPNLEPNEKDQLKSLLNDFVAELNRISTNQEDNFKKLYADIIKKCIAILKSVNLG